MLRRAASHCINCYMKIFSIKLSCAIEKKKILIADDSQINREMLAEMLGDEYEYILAEDGKHLLRLLSENVQADILLLDMHMPNMNGMDVLKIMQARNWTDTLPVVIISSENDMGVIRNAYRLGANDYIQRPFDAFMVRHRVENVLKLYARNRRLVRLVDPVQRRVLYIQPDGGVATGDQKCYSMWNCSAPCKNCVSRKAIHSQN